MIEKSKETLAMANKRNETCSDAVTEFDDDMVERLFVLALEFLEDLGLSKEEMKEIQTEDMTVTEFFIAANKRLLQLTVNGEDEDYELVAMLRNFIPELETIRAKQTL